MFNVLLSPRFKSFYWRSGMMFVAGFIALIAKNLELFHLPIGWVTLVGLVLGEVSKALNNRLKGKLGGFVRQ